MKMNKGRKNISEEKNWTDQNIAELILPKKV